MNSRVTIVDYGVGNLLSVTRAFEHCGATVQVTGDPKQIASAGRLVLPGVGTFGDCMSEIASRGLDDALRSYFEADRPFLGICVGMQILLEVGEEFGFHHGFGIVPGRVVPIPSVSKNGNPHKIPHIGWTPLELPTDTATGRWQGTILAALKPGVAMYFVHSFTAVPGQVSHRLADCHYGGHRIAASIQRGNLFGCQFHPEKSGKEGLAVISGFLAL